jgi:uncharacterized protein
MSAAQDLDRHRYLALATYRATGAEVRTPVWFTALNGKLYVFTAGDSGKVKRLRRSPRVRIAPCDMRGEVRGEWRDSTARIIATPPPGAEAALGRKYGWQKRLLNFFSRLAGRIKNRAWIEIDA